MNIHKVLKSSAGLEALVLRAPVGLVLAAHGGQKLFGWFGGYGLDATGQWMASQGFTPGYVMALLAGCAEFFGGLALMIGFLTRPAALVTAFTMLMAMTVHVGNGLFLANNGYEFALSLLAITSSLMLMGGGQYSVDQLITSRLGGTGLAYSN